VSVGGDWIANNLVAGVMNASGNFGDGNDAAIAGGSATIVSRIRSVAIRGLVYGTAASDTDHFGFVAQHFGWFKTTGFAATFTAAYNEESAPLADTTGDVTIREVA